MKKKTKSSGLNFFLIGFNSGVIFLFLLFYLFIHLLVPSHAENVQLRVQYSTYSLDFNHLYNQTINGILVYSDVDNFARISKDIDSLGVTILDYPMLKGIIYYQNTSDNYSSMVESKSCDGSFYPYEAIVDLYKCDGDIELRGNMILSNVSEEFILAHELGHYLEIYDNSRQQKWADEYAQELLKL